MAAPSQERRPTPIFTLHEEQSESNTLLDDEHPDGFACFRSFPCFGSTREHPSESAGAWIGKRAKSVREFTEVVAGPKWKNIVRKVGGYFTHKKRRGGIQYDSFDYALNFVDGLNEEEEHERLVHGIPTRFVVAPTGGYRDNNMVGGAMHT